MNRGNLLLCVALFSATILFAQHRSPGNSAPDITSIGIGIGFDHGGIGANALFYPQDNLGFFIGAGYAVAGLAVNAGLKYRLIDFSKKYHPFFSVMYGHNALITTTNAQDKLFYGITPGIGIDIRPRWGYNYFSISLLVPIQGAEMRDYLDKNPNGVSFSSTTMPISFSVSYRFGFK